MVCESCADLHTVGGNGKCNACGEVHESRTPEPNFCMSASEEVQSRQERGLPISKELMDKAAKENGF